MYTKAKIYNLALGALLLSRQIIDTETDKSNERVVLGTHWDTALRSTLEDMDLDATSSQVTLELIELDPNDLWGYSYKYPSDCTYLRRLQSCVVEDNRSTHIPRRIAIKGGVKCIFTNKEDAIAEYISDNVPLSALSANAGLAVAYKLALLSAPLIVGKGAKTLMADIQAKYLVVKAEAQEQDQRENFNFEDPEVTSEFVQARIE
jgi:hypothetical protein